MKLRYAGACARCGTTIEAGVTADYVRATRSVTCVECPPQRASQEEAGVATAAPRRAAEPVLTLEHVDGEAGASAVREFERRHDARRERVIGAHPKVGRFLLAVFDDPQSTTAWSTGAVGEQRLGQALSKVAGPRLRVLNDRRIPKTRANIDHLIVCPTGVFVVDAKRYRNARSSFKVEGGLFEKRRRVLTVGGRDRTPLIEGMHKQLGLVGEALAGEDVPLHGYLCFLDADWPLFPDPFTVADVGIVWLKRLITILTKTGPLDEARIEDLQWRLHEAFPRQN